MTALFTKYLLSGATSQTLVVKVSIALRTLKQHTLLLGVTLTAISEYLLFAEAV